MIHLNTALSMEVAEPAANGANSTNSAEQQGKGADMSLHDTLHITWRYQR